MCQIDAIFYPCAGAWITAYAAVWCQNHGRISFSILGVCWAWTVILHWKYLWGRISSRWAFTPHWAHRSPPQKLQLSLLFQFFLYLPGGTVSGRAAAWSHIVTSSQVLTLLCSDVQYSVKVFLRRELESTDGQGVHGSSPGCYVASSLRGQRGLSGNWLQSFTKIKFMACY